MHQNLCQVLLIQDEEVGEAVCLHVGCAAVSSASGQQTSQSERRQGERERAVCPEVDHFLINKINEAFSSDTSPPPCGHPW